MSSRPRVETRQLHYFLAVIEAGSISGAAQKLHLSQPPLTSQIRRLEALIGAPLFERHKRGVTPTAAGERLAEEARQLLALADHAIERVQQIGRGEAGVLRVGTIGSLMWSDLRELFTRFQKQYPDVNCVLIDLTAEQQIVALGECSIDVGFWRTPLSTGPNLRLQRLVSESLCVALPQDHRLGRRRPLRLADLAGEPMLMIDPETSRFGRFLLESCRAAGFEPQVAHYANEPIARLALVSAGRGVALMPDSLRRVNWPGVRFCALAGAPLSVDLYMAYRDADTSAVVSNFRRSVSQPLE